MVMNFLGHIYLTGTDKELLLGNFMADSIKGKSYLDYPIPIQKGVLFHRFIDSYTDSHSAFRKSTAKLHADYSHYSGVIVDIFYDHFLAKYWKEYHSTPLETFAQDFYTFIRNRYSYLTPEMQYIFPYMHKNNWLMRYTTLEGIQTTLTEMNNRIGKEFNLHKATKNLQEEYDSFHKDFKRFFMDIQEESKLKRQELNTL